MRSVLLCALLCAPAWADSPAFVIQDNQLEVPAPVVFKTGAAELAPESAAALDHVKAYLEAKKYVSLMRVEVHTDNLGDPAKNQALSEQRALGVAAALVARGVDCKRLLAVGFGQNKPIAANDTPENQARNRRVAFVNAALMGKAIGGMPVDGGGVVAGDACR